MTHVEKLDILRDFARTVREFEAELANLLDTSPTEAQIYRLGRTRDAVARCRGQVGHLAAELVIGHAGELAWEGEDRPCRAIPLAS